jgi:hypothetical protein
VGKEQIFGHFSSSPTNNNIADSTIITQIAESISFENFNVAITESPACVVTHVRLQVTEPEPVDK